MKKLTILTLAILLCWVQLSIAQTITPTSVRREMQRVADWQIDHFRDSYSYKSPHHIRDWTNGALYVGMTKWAAMAPTDTYYKWLREIGEKGNWELHERKYMADDHTVGQMYLELYRKYGDTAMLAGTKNSFDYILDNPSPATLIWESPNNQDRWSWCDALFMAPPVWAKLASITGDKKYSDFMLKEYKATTEHLFDQEENLYFRDGSFKGRLDDDGHKIFWARGNGWVFGGLTLVMDEYEPDSEEYKYVLGIYKKMAKKLLEIQTPEGHWAMSLLGQEKYPTPETSGTSFFTFGLAWGINNGVLDRATYEPAVVKAWSALVSYITEEGMLGYVQPIGAAPGSAWPDKSEVYGTGAFLSAGSEVYKMYGGQPIFQIENPDYDKSPYTGMTREHWKDAANYVLEGAFGYIQRIDDPMKFPKLEGRSYPREASQIPIEKLEGLCRTLFIAAPILRENPDLTFNNIKVADYYRHQILQLLNPESPSFLKNKKREAGPSQILVEFGALAISLSAIPEILWEPLTQAQKDSLAVKMISYADGPTVPSNWKFFNIFILSFFKEQGYKLNETLLKEYLEKSLDHYRGDGWYNDNPAYDYYSMWAFQMYGSLWAELYGKKHFPEIADQFIENFKELKGNYSHMFSQDGKMIMWGRSISYRIGSVVPFPLMGYYTEMDANWGWNRRISSGVLQQFLQHPLMMKDGVPTLGFYGEFDPAVQYYSCRGSVYWMGKVFLGLLTPEDSPFWTATETEGAWGKELSPDEANNIFFEKSEILVTDYTNIGASEIRAWCNVPLKNQWEKFRGSENYNRLSYSSAFPWQADGENGEVAMNYLFKEGKVAWEAGRLYTFKKFDEGVYYRDLEVESNKDVLFKLADIPLKNGILRVDQLNSKSSTHFRLGHYALPHINNFIHKEKRKVGKYKVQIIGNGEYQLALVPLSGWDSAETITTSGLHPETEESTIMNLSKNYEPTSKQQEVLATLMLWKPAGEPWADDELDIVKSIKPQKGNTVKVIFKNGNVQLIKYD
ncbi:DUF2264 domain-containing protein [Flammeovirgaceae bacterium SG7u.111]|nr:DUF2264 domain-containing protein [Flammeovirgaceae bacterium SG7u.132]WPO38429.1 DUF2264 domain-containing protein [Flammeovirgaceae bacterium SG7u.111]